MQKKRQHKELNIADGWNIISLVKFLSSYVTCVIYLSILRSSSIVESLFYSCLDKNSLKPSCDY